jgi:hypothetical protein
MRKDLGLDWNKGFATVAVFVFLAGAAGFLAGACTRAKFQHNNIKHTLTPQIRAPVAYHCKVYVQRSATKCGLFASTTKVAGWRLLFVALHFPPFPGICKHFQRVITEIVPFKVHINMNSFVRTIAALRRDRKYLNL